MTGDMVILATDSGVLEAALYDGNSTIDKLFDLIVHLKTTEIKYYIKLIAKHVTGTRMIVQETDGISRGSIREGVAAGREILKFCPWRNQLWILNQGLKYGRSHGYPKKRLI